MPDKKFELGDYVEVKDRIRILYELFPQARIETEYQLTAEPDDKPKVISRAFVYRKPEDEKPAGHGTSWLYLPGATPYTRGSEIENAETSAVGRAIGMLGILIAGGMASKQEIDNKAGQSNAPAGFVQTKDHPIVMPDSNGGLIGIATLGKIAPVDGLVRQTPEGNSVGFVIGEGREKVQVVAYGELAESLAVVLNETIGKRVQVFGPTSPETMKAGGKTIPFLRMRLERIEGPGWTLPRTEALPPPLFDDLPEPPDDDPLVGEKEAAA